MSEVRMDATGVPGTENAAAKGVMMYRLGRFLQLLGLLIAPAGLAGNLARPDLVGEGQELAILAGGLAVFGLGWLIQRYARPQ